MRQRALNEEKERWIQSVSVEENLVFNVKMEIEVKEETSLNLASKKELRTQQEHKRKGNLWKKRQKNQCSEMSLLLDFELFSFVPLRLN